MLGLTRRQADVLTFIREFIAKNGYSPSYEEIGVAMNLSSLATIGKHVQNLRTRGHITFQDRVGRSIICVK